MCAWQVSVDIFSTDGKLQLRADAVQVIYAGFLRAFENFDTGNTGMPDFKVTRQAFPRAC